MGKAYKVLEEFLYRVGERFCEGDRLSKIACADRELLKDCPQMETAITILYSQVLKPGLADNIRFRRLRRKIRRANYVKKTRIDCEQAARILENVLRKEGIE